jgi:hypothetical protein
VLIVQDLRARRAAGDVSQESPSIMRGRSQVVAEYEGCETGPEVDMNEDQAELWVLALPMARSSLESACPEQTVSIPWLVLCPLRC